MVGFPLLTDFLQSLEAVDGGVHHGVVGHEDPTRGDMTVLTGEGNPARC